MSALGIIGSAQHSSVEGLLDAFAAAAATGDLRAYFGCFHDAATSRFLGTDVNENWTASEFLEFARPHFKSDGTPAWVYVPLEGKRKVDYIGDSLACFDEHLSSESFKATSRGSGSCVRNASGHWLLVQYYLSFPIPNDLAKGFCESIARWERGAADAQQAQLAAKKLAVAATVAAAKAAAAAVAASPSAEREQAMNTAINLADKLALVTAHWSPKVVAELNNYQLKVAKLLGDFVWHSHKETDEVFIVLQGQLRIDMHSQGQGAVALGPGEMCVVRRGDLHKPFAQEEVHVLLVEPRDVVNTGDDAPGALTASNDEWI